MPMFEAISNSMHAIEVGHKDGQITVYVHRSTELLDMGEEVKPLQSIVGFTIEDNGIGFTDANYESFWTADSTHKQSVGGKAVGRLSWPKAFERTGIKSVYRVGPKTWIREFIFDLTLEGQAQGVAKEVEGGAPRTSIRLSGYDPEYQQKCPKQTDAIARKITEHFLESFALQQCPLKLALRSIGRRKFDPPIQIS
jgi:hypothetical protein